MTRILVVELLLVACLSVTIVALWQVIRTPKSHFGKSQLSKNAWVALILGSSLLTGFTGVFFGMYFVMRVKPHLDRPEWEWKKIATQRDTP